MANSGISSQLKTRIHSLSFISGKLTVSFGFGKVVVRPEKTHSLDDVQYEVKGVVQFFIPPMELKGGRSMSCSI